MNKPVKSIIAGLMLAGLLAASSPAAFADDITKRGVSGRSVVAGVLSFLIWPGIGQAVNDNQGKKVVTHAVLGLVPPYRFWSGYDALVDRHGGYWEGRI